MCHYSRYFTFDDKKCYECGGSGHILRNGTKKNKAARPNTSSKPKARAFYMMLDEADVTARDQE